MKACDRSSTESLIPFTCFMKKGTLPVVPSLFFSICIVRACVRACASLQVRSKLQKAIGKKICNSKITGQYGSN